MGLAAAPRNRNSRPPNRFDGVMLSIARVYPIDK